MILVVGLSAAWQRVYRFERFEQGIVNRAASVDECASGKGLNVAVALRLLGAECRTISFLGRAALERIDAEMEFAGVGRRWIETAAPTRVCCTILDRASDHVTELVENAWPITAAELEEFHRVLAEEITHADLLVLTGSLPPGAPADLYGQICRMAKCPVIVDGRGPELQGTLPCRPLVVKPNRAELAATVGRPLSSDADVSAAIHELADRGAQWIVVSDGGHAGWLYDEGKMWRFPLPPLDPVVNTIGCGDVLMAGLAAAIAQGQSPRDALRLGVAAAAASALHVLPGRFDPAVAARLVDQTPTLERSEG